MVGASSKQFYTHYFKIFCVENLASKLTTYLLLLVLLFSLSFY
nr:MAG TPA: hypothetical protein [Crassvirales sp.]